MGLVSKSELREVKNNLRQSRHHAIIPSTWGRSVGLMGRVSLYFHASILVFEWGENQTGIAEADSALSFGQQTRKERCPIEQRGIIFIRPSAERRNVRANVQTSVCPIPRGLPLPWASEPQGARASPPSHLDPSRPFLSKLNSQSLIQQWGGQIKAFLALSWFAWPLWFWPFLCHWRAQQRDPQGN